MVVKHNGKRYSLDFLKSNTLEKVISVCTDTKTGDVTEAWNKANVKPKEKRTSK